MAAAGALKGARHFTKHFEAMAKYNRWANRAALDHAQHLSDGDYFKRSDYGLPFNTIHGTFNHILFADSLWLMRITGKESLPTTVLPEGLTMEAVSEYWRDDHSWDGATQSLAEVDDRLMAMSDQYALLIGDLDDEKLHEHFTYHDTSGTPHERAVAPMLSHVFNHATHHRGQLSSAMFAALGTYFVTDFPAGPDFYE